MYVCCMLRHFLIIVILAVLVPVNFAKYSMNITGQQVGLSVVPYSVVVWRACILDLETPESRPA